MSWNYPEISLEDLMKLVKGFVDMLILTSGHQSSGFPAQWDAENCRKALQWGLFFENVLKSITSSDKYAKSVIELDEAISEMKSNPLFPKGLGSLSSSTLIKGREFVLGHLVDNVTLRDKHLKAILVAAVELGDDVIDIITSKLQKRQSVVSCASALETGLDILSKNIENGCWSKEALAEDGDQTLLSWGQQLVELSTWNNWKSKSVSYFLSKRTMKLVSGASLIFSAPKVQWAEVLKGLHDFSESNGDIFLQKIELLLLGCVASRWTHLVEHIMSVSYNSVTMAEQYEELCKLLLQRSKSLNQHVGTSNSKVEEILEFLTEILHGCVHNLWRIPCALAGAAIPSWSPLFSLYFGEVEKQLKQGPSASRICSTVQDAEETNSGELAERIWGMYAFHVRGFHQMN